VRPHLFETNKTTVTKAVTPPNPANTTNQPGILENQEVVVVFTFWGAAIVFFFVTN